MAQIPTLDEVVVGGTDPNWWTGDALSEALRQYSIALQMAQHSLPSAPVPSPDLAFMAPLPQLIEELPTVTKEVTVTSTRLPIFGTILTGIGALLYSKDLGDANMPAGVVYNPPPPGGGGGGTITPDDELPNWEDISKPRPGVDYGDPVKFPGIPIPGSDPSDVPLLDEFIVNPPQATPRPPPVEVPIGFPGADVFPGFDFNPVGSPAPGRQPQPDGAPGSDPAVPLADPFTTPWLAPDVRTPGVAAPDLYSPPLGVPTVDPVRIDFPSPFPDVPPGELAPDVGVPTPRPSPAQPDLTDWLIPGPNLDDLPQFNQPPINGPPSEADSCNCPKPKKRKPRPPRNECWKGTYVQRARGISYTKREMVPCEGSIKPPKPTASSLSSEGVFLSSGVPLSSGGLWDATFREWGREAKRQLRKKQQRDKAAKHRELDKRRAAAAKAKLAKERAKTKALREKLKTKRKRK